MANEVEQRGIAKAHRGTVDGDDTEWRRQTKKSRGKKGDGRVSNDDGQRGVACESAQSGRG